MEYQSVVLNELHVHENHPGIVRMKSLARMHVWWPNLDIDIESKVRTCRVHHQQHPLTHGSGRQNRGSIST